MSPRRDRRTLPQAALPATRSRLADTLRDVLMAAVGLIVVLSIASAPLTAREQAIFAVATMLTFMVCNRFARPLMSMLLIALSLAVSIRYIFWRVTETLQFGSWTEFFFGYGLALAEVYAITVLVLGYVQTAWPLSRAPLPLPADPQSWPRSTCTSRRTTRPMTMVRATVLAALAMDWPADKFSVFILDDGRRRSSATSPPSAAAATSSATTTSHAKAGNLNAAMTRTDGEFIAVFDCDHIPTRAFLQ